MELEILIVLDLLFEIQGYLFGVFIIRLMIVISAK